tara:strand:- start:398 stop:1150 length:753 start_codon:yes stop_codon:yes gene_type:complete
VSAVTDIILLRGLLRSQKHWGPFPEEMQKRFPEFKIHCVELPGIGEEASQASPLTLKGIAEKVNAKAQEKCAGRKSHIVGVSLGGMVGLELVSLFPENYGKVLVINTSSALSPKTKRLRWQVWSRVLAAALQTNKVKREALVIPYLANSTTAQKAMEESWERTAKDLKMHPLLPVAQLRAASGFVPDEKLKNSTQIYLLHSLGDLFVDPSCSEVLIKEYHWPFKTHPWAGHDLAWDDPEWLLTEIQSFFS